MIALVEDKRPKQLTESVQLYPAGRGKILAIIKKSIPPKRRSHKRKNPKFLHYVKKTNPNNLALVEYLTQDDIKRIYLFPPGIQLSLEDRKELAASLLTTIPKVPLYSKSNILDKSKSSKVAHFPHFFSRSLMKRIKFKWRRYMKWQNKQP